MKWWIVAALVLALGIMLAGCARGKVDAGNIAEADGDNRMFFRLSYEYNGLVLVDKATGVMYLVCGNYGGVTLLVNSDGTPRIWEG